MADKPEQAAASGSQQGERNTDVFLSIPSTGTEKTISMEEWTNFLTELHDYAGEHFLTGTDALRVTYEGLMRASGIPIEQESEAQTS